jgi:DNA-binding CsgD family transcriptional regulator
MMPAERAAYFNINVATLNKARRSVVKYAYKAEVLNLIASGKTNREISLELNVRANSFESQILRDHGAETRLQAVIVAIDRKELDTNELLKGARIELLDKLSVSENNLLEATLKNNGKRSDIKGISASLNVSVGTSTQHFREICSKLGLNHVRSVVLYKVAQMQKICPIYKGDDPRQLLYGGKLFKITDREKGKTGKGFDT